MGRFPGQVGATAREEERVAQPDELLSVQDRAEEKRGEGRVSQSKKGGA
jgi:hypothetical protein